METETTWQKLRRRIREALEDWGDLRAERQMHALRARWVREGRRIAQGRHMDKLRGKAVAAGVQAWEWDHDQACKALDARKARRAEAVVLWENNARFWRDGRARQAEERQGRAHANAAPE